MALRPVFIPSDSPELLVETRLVDFEWFSGMSVSQKQKSILSLHQSAMTNDSSITSILEVSSKSTETLGVELSAFNLMIVDEKKGLEYSVETAFQSSKVFEFGGPYKDLLCKTSIKAKKDKRLKESGRLKEFRFYNQAWPLEPETAFYDYLYINAIALYPKLHDQICSYAAFTDIEFNPKKSINCQAYSLALFVAIKRRGLLDAKRLKVKEEFLNLISQFNVSNSNRCEQSTPSLF